MRSFVVPTPKLPSILANTNQVWWKDCRDRSVADAVDARVGRCRLTHCLFLEIGTRTSVATGFAIPWPNESLAYSPYMRSGNLVFAKRDTNLASR